MHIRVKGLQPPIKLSVTPVITVSKIASQSPATNNTPVVITFPDTTGNGVNMLNNELVFDTAGIYDMRVLYTADKTGTGNDYMLFWQRINGVDPSDSSFSAILSHFNQNAISQTLTTSFPLQYIEVNTKFSFVMERKVGNDMRLGAFVYTDSPNVPASVIQISRLES